MAKNTPKTTSTRAVFERRIVTAIHDNSPVSSDFCIDPEVAVPKNVRVSNPNRPLKVGGNMWTVRQILEEANGKIELQDAVDKLLSRKTYTAKNPRRYAAIIFLEANKYRVPCKIEKVGEGKEAKTYIELI